MKLVIDKGNTRIKWALFDKKIMLQNGVEEEYGPIIKNLKSQPDLFKQISSCLLCDVGERNDKMEKELGQLFNFMKMSETLTIPITTDYKSPNTLGMDRLVGCVRANILFPKKNILVIDAGTCITYDFIDQNACYQGGIISPGLTLKAKSLNHYTANLPLVKTKTKVDTIGKTTHQSLESGINNGSVYEMAGFIGVFNKKYKNLKIIITGGDHSYFENALNFSIFAIPNLLLEGLNDIIDINADFEK